MKYFIIGSSSAGNAVIYHNEILIDVGFSYKTLKPHLKNVKYIMLTHVHGDHFNLSTINSIVVERPDIFWVVPNYLLDKIKQIGLTQNVLVVEANKRYRIGDYRIKLDELVHDVPNVAYHIYTRDNHKTLHATDTTTVDHIEAKNYDLIMLEANYKELDMLDRIIEKTKNNIFAYEIRAYDSHLSFEQFDEFVERNAGPNTVAVKLHVSSHYTDKEDEDESI